MTAMPASAPLDNVTRGFFFALSAYLLWGVLPLYLKLLVHIPVTEIMVHRILWSIPIAGAVLLYLGRTADIATAVRSRRTLAMASLTAVIITINWSVYAWAVVSDRALETALGYYINPLVNVVVGALLLGERFDRWQIGAVLLAALAVGIVTLDAGGLPWVSLVLAFSFAAYGFFRKTLPIGPSQGFFLEVLILGIPSLAWIVWLEATGQGHFFGARAMDTLLLLGCGPVTAVPLLLFGFGAKALKLSTIGIMQYIAPTLVFLIAVFVFGEPFSLVRGLAFALIWTALAIYSVSMFRRSPATPQAGAEA